MSYQAAAALQKSVFETLVQDEELSADLDGNIFDAPPGEELPDQYLLIGEETATDRSSFGSVAARHDFTVSLNSREAGYYSAKLIAARVCDLLSGAVPELERGCVSNIQLRSARARRGQTAERRQIVLNFRAHIDDI